MGHKSQIRSTWSLGIIFRVESSQRSCTSFTPVECKEAHQKRASVRGNPFAFAASLVDRFETVQTTLAQAEQSFLDRSCSVAKIAEKIHWKADFDIDRYFETLRRFTTPRILSRRRFLGSWKRNSSRVGTRILHRFSVVSEGKRRFRRF